MAMLLVGALTVQKRQQLPALMMLRMPPLALSTHKGQIHCKGPHRRVRRHQRGERRQLPAPWHRSPTQTQLPRSARWQVALLATAKGPLRLQMVRLERGTMIEILSDDSRIEIANLSLQGSLGASSSCLAAFAIDNTKSPSRLLVLNHSQRNQEDQITNDEDRTYSRQQASGL